MGGAQRNQRKRNTRQSAQAAKAIASARGANSGRNKMIAGVVVVVVFAAAIIGAVLYNNSQQQAKANDVIKATTVSSKYPVSVKGGVVTAGKPDAKVKLDFYEDFMCPVCGEFNKMYADDLETQLEKGTIQIRYNLLPFLDQNSNPPGYSGRAAAAALAVATNTPAKFPSFERSLFNSQPQEQGPGYTNDQLISLGKRLGVGGSFEQDVKSGKYKDTVQKVFEASKGPVTKVNQGGSYATPTIIHDGQNQKWGVQNPSGGPPQKTKWLEDLVK